MHYMIESSYNRIGKEVRICGSMMKKRGETYCIFLKK